MDQPDGEVVGSGARIRMGDGDEPINRAAGHQRNARNPVHGVPDRIVGQRPFRAESVDTVPRNHAEDERHGNDQQEKGGNGERLAEHRLQSYGFCQTIA